MTIRKHLEAIMEAAGNRPADKSGDLEAKEGTPAKTETDKVEQGKGTEVQGNTLGESIVAKIAETISESAEFKLDLTALKGLMESQELAEEFQTQAIGIFEAAVNDVAAQHIAKIGSIAESLIESELQNAIAVLEEETAQIVATSIAEWKEENAVAIETGIRTQVAESFMTGLAELLEAHNITLPEESVDLYEEAVAENERLAEAYQIAIGEGEKVVAENADLRKEISLAESVKDLSMAQAEKIKSLAESIEFVDEDTFKSQIKTLTEGYVNAVSQNSKSGLLAEDEDHLQEDGEAKPVVESVDPEVARLTAAIKKIGVGR